MELLRVRETHQHQDEVRSGASLGWHARLDVRGDFRGPAHLSPGAVLHVGGAFEGERIGRDGLLVVLGRCPLAVARRPGTVVGADVELVDPAGRSWWIDGDGVLTSSAPAAAGSARTVRWSAPLERFVDAVVSPPPAV